MITYGSTTLTSYNSIVKTEVYYYKSTSATSLSGGSWSTTKPTWENGKYIWQKIRTVYEDGTYSESDPVNITGQQGATGTAAYSYKLNSSDSIIGKTKDGEYTIKKITFNATYKQGTGAVSAYSGRFKIESTTNGSTWKTEYTSSGNESSKEFTIPDDIILIKCSLYQSDGTTVLLDIVTVPVVKDGVDAIGLRDSIPYYLASDKDTGITRLTQGWTRYRPQLTAEKKYLWVYYVSRYSEGTTEPELIEIKDDLVHFVNNGDESPVESCVVDIEPVQNLNGYDHPWPAGGGKNKLDTSKTFQQGANQLIIGQESAYSDRNTHLSAGTYTITVNATKVASIYVATDDAPGGNSLGSTSASRQLVLSADSNVSVWLYTSAGITSSDVVSFQLESGATATSYSPYSNICPITGWTGATVTRTGINLWDEEWELGLLNSDGSVSSSNRVTSKNYISVVPNKTYCFSFPDGIYAVGRGAYYDADKNLVQYLGDFPTNFSHDDDRQFALFTVPENASYLKFCANGQYGATYNNDISINYPSTDTDYHSGTDNETYSITFPAEAGTVYGGTLDVTKGELVVDRICHTYEGGTDDVISARSIDSSTKGLLIRTASAYNHAVGGNAQDSLNLIKPLCNKLKTTWFLDAISATNCYAPQGNWAPAHIIKVDDLTTTDEYDAWCAENKPQISWLLATPITYTLTPQEITMLCQENNIFADTGQTSIAYYDNQTSTDPFIDYSVTSAFEYADTAMDRAIATYGTCSTDSTVDAKVVICPDFVLFNGARIQVTFTNANTASAPTLNVNSTGAKAIYINKTVTSDTNLLLWTAGSKMEFVYDGTGWIAQNVPYALYGTCSTGASTAAKDVTCNEAVICKGTTISVNMTNTNTAADATMNVGSTLAKDIYANGAKLTTNSRFNWRANTTQKFVFDGQVWRMDDDSVKALATAYITEIDDDGIMVHPEDDSTSGWAISDAIQLFKNGISYIKLWIENNIPKIRIGKEDQGHIILDNDSVDIRNDDKVLASFGATSVIGDENDWHQTIAANQITFAKGDDIITYISPDKLYTINAEVADAFYISNYSIRNASDGKLVIGLRR